MTSRMTARPLFRPAVAGAALLTALLLPACTASTPSGATGPGTSSSSTSSSPDSAASTPTGENTTTDAEAADDAEKPVGELLDSGFGQSGEYVWVTSLVKNTSPDVGQFVTVQFNVLDAKGKLLASESQVEQFTAPGQTLVLGTQVTVPGKAKAAKVEATVGPKDNVDTAMEPFPTIPMGKVTISKGEYGGWSASTQLTNPTASALSSPRVGFVCYDTKKRVIGGSSEFPEMVPANGKALVKTDLLVSGKPASCVAYAGPGI